MSSSVLSPEVLAFFSAEIEKQALSPTMLGAAGLGAGALATGFLGYRGLSGAKKGVQKARQFGPLPGTKVF